MVTAGYAHSSSGFHLIEPQRPLLRLLGRVSNNVGALPLVRTSVGFITIRKTNSGTAPHLACVFLVHFLVVDYESQHLLLVLPLSLSLISALEEARLSR